MSSSPDHVSTLDNAYLRLQKLAVNLTSSGNSDQAQYFVLSSTAKYEQDLFSSEDLNLIFAKLGKVLLKPDEKRGLRNYFMQRAKSATNAH